MKTPVVVVGQSGGPTAAINASLAGVIEGARSLGAKTYGMHYGIQGALAGDFIDLDIVLPTPDALTALSHTPSSFLGSCRYKLPDIADDSDLYARLLKRFEDLGADAVLYIGGNDSMDTIAKLATYGASVRSEIRFVGIPKTIDNDLVLIDHTPGFGSAAKYVASTVRELALDNRVYRKNSVLFAEIMGRDAGWLAGSAALAGDLCDAVLLPETAFEEDALVEHVNDLVKERSCVLIAVSEGLKDASGELLCAGNPIVDAFGHKAQQSGTSRHLQELVTQRLGYKTRAVELSTTQRCAAHLASATDLSEARSLGCFGSREALLGTDEAFGAMASLTRVSDVPYETELELVDVTQVANRVKHVPASMIAPDGFGVTDEYLTYARPLIQGESWPAYVDGLPHIIQL